MGFVEWQSSLNDSPVLSWMLSACFSFYVLLFCIMPVLFTVPYRIIFFRLFRLRFSLWPCLSGFQLFAWTLHYAVHFFEIFFPRVQLLMACENSRSFPLVAQYFQLLMTIKPFTNNVSSTLRHWFTSASVWKKLTSVLEVLPPQSLPPLIFSEAERFGHWPQHVMSFLVCLWTTKPQLQTLTHTHTQTHLLTDKILIKSFI